ncbi:MAG: glycosyltransferase family 9 protein [Chitinophagaceae bacterium]|nr:MAG: glycosyltransferase family 9 protein [Chitinophagaceae bacterium]
MQQILVIQTAFIGDVVLATGILEKLHAHFPDAQIDILVRKGNETLFTGHPFLREVISWDKKTAKYAHLLAVLKQIRSTRYDILINVQRFAATGLLTAFSRARQTIGFDKNPFSFLFSDVVRHIISENDHTMHEIERNHQLIRSITDNKAGKPRLYPSAADQEAVRKWKQQPYVCIAPASVWFTKQFPKDQWIKLVNALPQNLQVYLIGAPSDKELCEEIRSAASHNNVVNLAGSLRFLESAALQQDAVMNYVNDSAPMHFASSVNAPVTAVYCSTIPAFGFGPLSDNSHIVEVATALPCRPCGLHGKKACPELHFNCARQITTEQLLAVLPK